MEMISSVGGFAQDHSSVTLGTASGIAVATVLGVIDYRGNSSDLRWYQRNIDGRVITTGILIGAGVFAISWVARNMFFHDKHHHVTDQLTNGAIAGALPLGAWAFIMSFSDWAIGRGNLIAPTSMGVFWGAVVGVLVSGLQILLIKSARWVTVNSSPTPQTAQS